VLSHGTWVIMFPEGTRSPRGKKGTYQTAGTRLAVQSGAPVVPIAVATARCWPKDGFVKPGGVATVSIGPLMESKGRDPKALMREAEAWIEAELRRIDPQAYRAADHVA
jgi:1-acyl-sn-glycerol-3-phosphate acyltransferase